MTSDEVSAWIEGLRHGDKAAEQAIWEKYFRKLVRMARNRLQDVPRRAFDEEDIALSALNSVMRGVRAGRFPKLDDRHDLWKLMVTITAGKIRGQKRRQTTRKRGSGQVRGDSAFGDGQGIGDVVGKEPSPELAFEISETCRELITGLPDDGLREVAMLKMEGFTNAEIADKIDRVVSTVERRLARIRKKWVQES